MNTREDNRITIVVRNEAEASVDWTHASLDRTLFADSVAVAKFTLLGNANLDVARIVIDRAGGADGFLDLLTSVPLQFNGDIVLISENGHGFLSAMGRGGDRVNYAVNSADVQFYLEAHDLIAERTPLRLIA